MADKTAQAMAAAMGMNIVEDDKTDSNVDQSQQQTDKQDTVDVDNTDKADTDQGVDQGSDQSSTDNKDTDKDQSSSDDQSSASDTSDQGSDKRTIPGEGDDSGTDHGTDFEAMLAERSNGRFKSLADIEKALEEAPQNAFANEQIAKLNEYVKGGGNIGDFVKTQTVDYTKMSPSQLVKEHIMMTEGLTAEEADFVIESDFGVSEKATERDRKLAEIKLKRESRRALDYLQDNQEKWRTPPGASSKEQQEQMERVWQDNLNKAVSSVNSIEIELNNTDKFSYKVEDATRNIIKEGLKKPQAFFNKYIKKDGSEDVDLFVKDMIKLQHFDEIVRSAAANNKSKGKQEILDDIKNPDYKGGSKSGQQQEPKPIITQAAEQFFKQ